MHNIIIILPPHLLESVIFSFFFLVLVIDSIFGKLANIEMVKPNMFHVFKTVGGSFEVEVWIAELYK